MTHICVFKLTIIGSDNGLSPGRRQAIILTNAGILLIGPLGTNLSELWIEILTVSFKKMRLKVSSAKWRPFCLGLNVFEKAKTQRDDPCTQQHPVSYCQTRSSTSCFITFIERVDYFKSVDNEVIVDIYYCKIPIWRVSKCQMPLFHLSSYLIIPISVHLYLLDFVIIHLSVIIQAKYIILHSQGRSFLLPTHVSAQDATLNHPPRSLSKQLSWWIIWWIVCFPNRKRDIS